jgi:hypothetical protein
MMRLRGSHVGKESTPEQSCRDFGVNISPDEIVEKKGVWAYFLE